MRTEQPTSQPTYDGAAYAIDEAHQHATDDEAWDAVGDLAHDALEQVSTAPYPHLVDRLHRQATDVVLSCKRDPVDDSHVLARLDQMQTTLAEMQALAIAGTTMLPDEFDD
ncbi:hypothetical protein ACFPYI_07855 [Halomarina salina]|uniref:Transposase n=1 Tax=Halomarina salina TaxID=1872699 RepID=A0ABD5RLS3_9EURY|nr:hypothetical protein [Halomarina salina]